MTTPLHPDTTTALAAQLDDAAGWLDKAGMTAEATALRALPPITDSHELAEAGAVVQPMLTPAYRRSGVLIWPEAEAGMNAVGESGGVDAWWSAVAPHPVSPAGGAVAGDWLPEHLAGFCSWVHTVACYAAQAAVAGRRAEKTR